MEQDTAIAAENLIIRLNEDTELRPVRDEDADEFYALIVQNRERLHRWLAWSTASYSLEDSREFIAHHVGENADGVSLTMSMWHKDRLCGAICLHRFDRRCQSTSIGYWIDEAHEGKGIVTAACGAIVNTGFSLYGLHRIEIRCATWNHRSSAIPRRLEFVEEGILREAEWLHDRWVDLRVFSMLAQDWTSC